MSLMNNNNVGVFFLRKHTQKYHVLNWIYTYKSIRPILTLEVNLIPGVPPKKRQPRNHGNDRVSTHTHSHTPNAKIILFSQNRIGDKLVGIRHRPTAFNSAMSRQTNNFKSLFTELITNGVSKSCDPILKPTVVGTVNPVYVNHVSSFSPSPQFHYISSPIKTYFTDRMESNKQQRKKKR